MRQHTFSTLKINQYKVIGFTCAISSRWAFSHVVITLWDNIHSNFEYKIENRQSKKKKQQQHELMESSSFNLVALSKGFRVILISIMCDNGIVVDNNNKRLAFVWCMHTKEIGQIQHKRICHRQHGIYNNITVCTVIYIYICLVWVWPSDQIMSDLLSIGADICFVVTINIKQLPVNIQSQYHTCILCTC